MSQSYVGWMSSLIVFRQVGSQGYGILLSCGFAIVAIFTSSHVNRKNTIEGPMGHFKDQA